MIDKEEKLKCNPKENLTVQTVVDEINSLLANHSFGGGERTIYLRGNNVCCVVSLYPGENRGWAIALTIRCIAKGWSGKDLQGVIVQLTGAKKRDQGVGAPYITTINCTGELNSLGQAIFDVMPQTNYTILTCSPAPIPTTSIYTNETVQPKLDPKRESRETSKEMRQNNKKPTAVDQLAMFASEGPSW